MEERVATLDEKYFKLLKEHGSIVNLPKGTIICEIGDVPEYVYYVISGGILSCVESFTTDEHIFDVIGPKSLVFVTAIFRKHPMNHYFKTNEDSSLLKIERSEFFRLLKEDNGFAINILYILSDAYLNSLKQHRERSSFPVEWRVCNFLLDRLNEGYYIFNGIKVIKEKFSQQDIANYIHANRVSIARSIKNLKEFGLINVIDGHYSISDKDKFISYMDLIS